MSRIQINNLNVWFGEKDERVDAVKDATFDVPSGASFGLVGESGSGKSTILRALVGLVPTWSGDMQIGDLKLGLKRPKAFYKDVQMVF